MKKKYLKKMLAIMLASMTVAATPGLVGAMKKESKDAIQAVNEQIVNHKLTITEAIKFLYKMEEILDEDDEAKKEVSATLRDMIKEGLFGKTSNYNCHLNYFNPHMCSPKNLARIIQIFKICSECNSAKINTARAIAIMAREGLFGRVKYKESYLEIPQCSSETLDDVIEILDNCLNYTDNSVKEADYFKTKKYVMDSVYQMARRGVLGSEAVGLSFQEAFRKCSFEQILKIMGFLEKCLKGNEGDVAYNIALLASGDLLNQYPYKNKILNMLRECLNNPEIDTRGEVAQAVCAAVARNLFRRNSFESILDMLKKCLLPCSSSRSYPYSIKSSVVASIESMVRYDMFGKGSVAQILDILNLCSGNCDGELLLWAITAMVEKGFLDEQNIGETFIQILQKFSNCDSDKGRVAKTIKLLTQRNLLNHRSVDKLKPIINLLLSCRGHGSFLESIQIMSEKNILNKLDNLDIQQIVVALIDCFQSTNDKGDVIRATKAMNDKNLLNKCDSEHIRKLVELLIGFLESDYSREEAANVILEIDGKGVLKKCEPDDLVSMVSSLINNLDNNKAREISVKIIAAIIQNHNVLRQLNDAQIQKLIDSLPQVLANNNTQEAATIILAAMAENDMLNKFNNAQIQQILGLLKGQLRNYLTAGNHEMVDKIFKVLKACSEKDGLKKNVIDVISDFAYNVAFYQYINRGLPHNSLKDIIEIYISCYKNQPTDVRAEIMKDFSNLLMEVGVGEAREDWKKDIILTGKNIEQISKKIEDIIKMLEESSQVDELRFDVAIIIRHLGCRGLLYNLENSQRSSLITALENCLKHYSDMEQAPYEQQDILTEVQSIFQEDGWINEFRSKLSEDENKKVENLKAESEKILKRLFDSEGKDK